MRYNFTGLTSEEVNESRKNFGSNELDAIIVESFWDKLINNFKDPIIIILSFALVIMFVLYLLGLTEWYEALAIAAAVALATLVATFSEYKNENSFQKLQAEASRITNTIFRNGKLAEIQVDEIVTGDYVLLQAGDKIPADGKLVQGTLKVNQSSLTGESYSLTKNVAPDDYQEEKRDLASPYGLFRGSVVEAGEAVMLVEVIGRKTFFGILAKELSESDTRLSPLQVKLANLAKLISKLGYMAAVCVAIAFIFNKAIVRNGFEGDAILEYFTNVNPLVPDLLDAMVLSIIVVVAAIPEGLPLMVAIVLSLNMRKLLYEKVLVRKLLGIETAGSLNVLFSDKTGTITKGQLESKLFIDSEGQTFDSYESIPNLLRGLLSVSILENSSSYFSSDGEIIGGNVSERALMSFVNNKDILEASKYDVQQEKKIIFNSERKFSAAQVKNVYDIVGIDIDSITLIKGAPEVILKQCNTYYNEDGSKSELTDTTELVTKMDAYADAGIRLIALAISEDPIKEDESLSNHATLVGVVGISDEVREESRISIQEVQDAGIQVVMITGDRLGTAESIAREVGLLQNEDELILVSSELNQKTDEEIKKLIPDLRVIARALPSDKSRLVRIFKSAGKVVGMTGDGVNDSAALKQSDVGIAMGSGSEVSKEAGDIIILDDNFHSISSAIRYGRTIFKSIRKFIVFQLTVNVAAVSTVFLGPLVGIDFPLTIIQLLWINMIMDTLAAIAFGGEPALPRYMHEQPINREDNILSKNMVSSILTGGIFITLFSIFFLTYEPISTMFVRDGVPNLRVHQSAFFNVFIFMILFNALNVRSENYNLFEHIKENKTFIVVIALIFFLQVIFTYIGGTILRTTALTLTEWAIVYSMALLIIPVDLIRKFIFSMLSTQNKSVRIVSA